MSCAHLATISLSECVGVCVCVSGINGRFFVIQQERKLSEERREAVLVGNHAEGPIDTQTHTTILVTYRAR